MRNLIILAISIHLGRLYLACQARDGDEDQFSLTKIMLAHHLCHREENCGLTQRQI